MGRARLGYRGVGVGYRDGGLGFRGWGGRGLGYGVAAGAIVGGAVARSAYYDGYGGYSGYSSYGYAAEPCYGYSGGYGYGGGYRYHGADYGGGDVGAHPTSGTRPLAITAGNARWATPQSDGWTI